MEISLLDHQWELLNSSTKHTLMLGGVGSGKTFAGCCFVYKMISEQPQATILIAANTYQQLRDVLIDALTTFLDEIGLEYKYNKATSIITIERTETRILCRSLDKYDNLRGIEIGSYWLDEVAYAKREAYDVVIGRLRDKNATRHHGILTTTPKGYNWLYDYFHESGTLHTNDFKTVSADTSKNRHLPDGYIDNLKAQYGEDSPLYQQEVLGEFVNLTAGKAYYAFERDKHVQEFNEMPGPWWTFCDFNVDPMTGGAAKVVDGVIYVHDEKFLRNSDTFKFVNSMAKYHGSKIVPDSTGKARSTTGKSNHEILKAKFDVVYNRNPHVIDRVNNINRLLSMDRIVIHPRCKKLINDLEQVSWKEGKNDLDQTTNKMLTHISDGLGYLANYLYPIKVNKTNSHITFE